MEEIKVGEYVRTKKGIHRIYKMNGSKKVAWYGRYLVEKGTVTKKDIIKHSPNIIDLIEVGDIISIKDSLYDNEYKSEVFADYDNVLCINNFEENEIIELMKNIENEQLKLLSILTKEQFKSVMYEVK